MLHIDRRSGTLDLIWIAGTSDDTSQLCGIRLTYTYPTLNVPLLIQ